MDKQLQGKKACDKRQLVPRVAASRVQQGSELGLVLFNIFITNLKGEGNCIKMNLQMAIHYGGFVDPRKSPDEILRFAWKGSLERTKNLQARKLRCSEPRVTPPAPCEKALPAAGMLKMPCSVISSSRVPPAC